VRSCAASYGDTIETQPARKVATSCTRDGCETRSAIGLITDRASMLSGLVDAGFIPRVGKAYP
jgi:hypothetical protein